MSDTNRNDFLTSFKPQSTNNAESTVSKTDQARAVAEIQAAMMIARMNPRDPVAAIDRILNACTRPTLADSAVYTYSRGGSDVSGPSIRLAETIAQSWGNMQFGIRELDQRNGESVVQAFAWDVETNTRREVTFHVPHIRHTRKGASKLEDPRDIYEMVANQGARRLRACILSVVPGDVVEAAVNQCEVTMKAKADTSPDAMKRMVEAFAQFGVTKEQIEARIQRRIDAIQPAQVVSLKKIYASLRDGMSSVEDWFSAGTAGDSPPKERPAYQDAELEKSLPEWQSAINAGKMTPDKIMTKISSRYRLSPEQRARISALKKEEADEGVDDFLSEMEAEEQGARDDHA